MSDSTAVLRARIDLPTTTGSVPIARHLVTQLLAAWSAKARHEESMLLLSELVTNVVRHVRPTTTFTIELILSQLKLRVSVLDSSPTPPVVRDRSPAGGHGLWLVTAMADRWGSARHGTGNRCGSSSTDDPTRGSRPLSRAGTRQHHQRLCPGCAAAPPPMAYVGRRRAEGTPTRRSCTVGSATSPTSSALRRPPWPSPPRPDFKIALARRISVI